MKKLLCPKSIRIIFVILFFVNIIFSTCVFGINEVSAASSNTDEAGSAGEMWTKASSWFGKVNTDETSNQSKKIINEFVSIVNVVGTTVIVIATIFLGIKYIFGTVDSKADVKESLITLLIACVFFFGWSNLYSILFPGNRLIFAKTADTSYKDLVGRVFNIVVYIANFAAILGVIYVGIRYIFSGAGGRADLKGKAPYFIIGIILSFATVSFLTFLSGTINEILVK